jgi:ATP-dependent DNA helicase RecQ
LPIKPRKKWPDGGMPQYGVKGFIAPAHQAESGMALCLWGAAGWGGLVRQGKYRDGREITTMNSEHRNLLLDGQLVLISL